MMQGALRRIYGLLPSLAERSSIIQLVNLDLYREAQGTAMFFPLDFYEIHNYLFPLGSGNRDMDVVRYYFENLAHQMVLLPPSAWELIRYLERQSNWLRTIYHPSSTLIDEFLKSQELHSFCQKLEAGAPADEILRAYDSMGRYRRILDFLREDGIKTILEEPAQSFVRLLDTGRLVALETVVDGTAWQELDNDVFKAALDAFDERRPAVEKRTPNRIDALNLAMTFTLNTNHYTSSSGGSFFVIVTHGAATERVYSRIRWRDDPLPLSRGTPLNRSHRYCAYHAYFESLTDPRQAIHDYMDDLDQVDALKEQFESLFQSFGREYLAKSSKEDPGVAAELRGIHEELERIQDKMAVIDRQARIAAEVEPWDGSPNLLDRLASKDQIRAVLIEHISVANNLTRMVFERVEPIVRSLPVRMLDHEFEKIITFITSPSVTAIPPEEVERFSIKAFFKGQRGDQPFTVGRTYVLRAGIRWHRPDRPNESSDLTFHVLVRSQDMDVSPQQIQKLVVYPSSKFIWLEFSMTPRSVGTKKTRVEFYHRLNGLGQIDLELRVVGDKEPLYRNLYESVVSELRPIPMPAHVDPVTVQITINRWRGNEYEAFIQSQGNNLVTKVDMSPHDLDRLNDRMQRAAAQLALCNNTESQSTSEEMQAALQDLAEQGKLAYNLIFNKKAKSFLKDALKESTKVIIQINSDDLLVPWDLVYDGDPKTPEFGRFWGMRYIISRITLSGRRDGSFVSPKVLFETRPKVGLLTDASLSAVRSKEIPFFKALDYNGSISLVHLRPLELEEENAFEEFIQFWRHEFSLAHFACHAMTEENDPFSLYLQISNDYPIHTAHLLIYNFQAYNHPLVILNACRTGVVSPLQTIDLARTFLRCAARGVLATECAIPDSLAADFAEALYRHLLQGRTLGESLMLARWELWKMYKNPSGLLYAMYAPDAICLVKRKGE
jgi:hypothetical protein